ncbi:tryptophan synthase subunit alpha [Hahella sp. CCB-MM4]|uniref:tryptophan synthase subunit alpha n=1 Tax=Hahella sp. (strain CCB-MM4) TaxID=1926491 RepID=UPI000B9A1E3F|nr:tryptophan synthase subunit alpha [Hahella sp. CCB-MM4]OZG73660.1 tryptophan synthase subunit alpha [Hahella sp. CCB-MM4]
MSRITSCLSALKDAGKAALIPYVTAGDPNPSATVGIMHTLVEAGADIIELGVPFSDPMADGPVIQLACERALEHGTSLRDVLNMVAEFREKDQKTPVVLMGYLNPVEAMGMDHFIEKAKQAGVDGVLTVDLPPEEADEVVPVFREAGLDAIFLLAPTTTNERIKSAVAHGSGYIYYVSLKGVTGSSALNIEDVSQQLTRIRSLTDMPVGVGFGIKDAESAAAVSKVADGVIVGSALVNTIAENADSSESMHEKVKSLIGSMRSAMDQ